MKKALLLALLPFAAFAFRPPAVPLVQCDPFFSVWSAGDQGGGRPRDGRAHLPSSASIDPENQKP